MEIPKGITMPGGMPHKEKAYVLELKKNLYGQKQAGQVWYKHLSQGLIKLGFKQSNIDD
jgi:Reverse transcriptase (RNA-dependent DNA polymerase)